MSTATVVTAFQTLHSGITGVKSAPTELPGSLSTAALPLVFTWPGETVDPGWQPGASGDYIVFRTYVIRCYVKPLQQGSGFDEGYQLALTLFDRFGAAYMANPQIDANENITLHTNKRDSGVHGRMQWGIGTETFYHGFMFMLDVKENV